MPTSAGTTGTPLTPQAALDKLSGLITEVDDDADSTPQEAPGEPPAPPEPPQETAPSATEPEAEADPEAVTHSVTVDGSPEDVSLADLKRNYSNHAALTRQRQQFADQRREFETERDSVHATSQEMQGKLEALTEALDALNGEPDWVIRRREVPAEQFLQEKADWEARKAQTDKLRVEAQRVAQRNQEEQRQQVERYVATQRERLHAAYPDLTDDAKKDGEWSKLRATAKAYGFSDEQIKQAVDHRVWLMLRDAMRYRELHKEPTPRARQAAIKTARPGTPERPRPNVDFEKVKGRAQQTGRQRDAMDAIAYLIE